MPDWFADHAAREAYIHAAEDQTMFSCHVGAQLAGMAALTRHSDWNMEISVMGVRASHQRSGIGAALVDAAEDHAARTGVRLLSVKTISAASKDRNYAATRAFYQAVGFEPFEEFPNLWSERNPCVLLIRPVKRTHGATPSGRHA